MAKKIQSPAPQFRVVLVYFGTSLTAQYEKPTPGTWPTREDADAWAQDYCEGDSRYGFRVEPVAAEDLDLD